MRRDGLWNPQLLAHITAMGHGETLVIADAGLPIPDGVPRIDLVWKAGEPSFLPVLRAVLDELVVEGATVASEVTGTAIDVQASALLADTPVERISHAAFKDQCRGARVIVRTGETTPYANVLLRAGVPF